MPNHELAQLNIARMKAPLEDPLMADFAANLDRINALAEQHPGFRWRLKTDEGNATALRPFGEEMLVNLSVWKDLQSLRDYVFASDHVEIMKRRREWFDKMEVAYLVFWWVPEGHHPSVDEARLRLETLQRLGPTAEAFTFRNPFPAPDLDDPQRPVPLLDVCPSA